MGLPSYGNAIGRKRHAFQQTHYSRGLQRTGIESSLSRLRTAISPNLGTPSQRWPYKDRESKNPPLRGPEIIETNGIVLPGGAHREVTKSQILLLMGTRWNIGGIICEHH